MVPEALVQDIEEQTVEDIRTGRVAVREQIEGPSGQRLWDNIDGSWTKPLPSEQAPLFLRKLVYRCDACHEASNIKGAIPEHIRQVLENVKTHQRARIKAELVGRETIQVCTGCKTAFPSRRQQGVRHLERVRAMGPAHANAKEVLMARFSLGPPQGAKQ